MESSSSRARTFAEPNKAFPTTFAQQRLWPSAKSDRSVLCQRNVGLRLRGQLDRQVLQAALDRIVARHEVLRCTFHCEDGEPLQIIGPRDSSFALSEQQVDGLPELDQIRQRELCAPFDLGKGPLIRGILLRISALEHVLLITSHSIVSDKWSIGVLVRELSVLYNAFVLGRPDPLQVLPQQYTDYSSRQRQLLQGQRLEKEVELWREHLSGAPSVIQLPTDRMRLAADSYAAGGVSLRLGQELTDRLGELSQKQAATTFMVLLTGWAVLLARWSGQEEVVIATPMSRRERPEFGSLIGCFENTLPLRVRLHSDLTVAQLIEQVRTTALGAHAHQDIPFQRVIEALHLNSGPGHRPFSQAYLELNSAPESAFPPGGAQPNGLNFSELPWVDPTTQFELSLSLWHAADGLAGTLTYATELFDHSSIGRLASHLQVLLDGMAANPQCYVSQLPVLTADQRRQVLHDFNATTDAQDRLIHRLFEIQADRAPDAVAVECEGLQMTYADLNRRANRVAHTLIERGVNPDQRVMLCAERGLEMVVGLLGILKAGGAYVPIDTSYPAERVAFMLEDSSPVAVITQRALLGRVSGLKRPIVVVDDDLSQSSHSHNPVVAELNPRSLAYVIYTSGSTGTPKGVMVEHSNVVRLFTSTEGLFHFGAQDVWTLFHSIAFDFSVWELWGGLLYGGRVVIVPYITARSPSAFYQLVCERGVTVLNQTPSAFRQLIAAQRAAEVSRMKCVLRLVIFGGEALELASLRPWVARNGTQSPRLVNMYGITETTVHVTYRELREEEIESERSSVVGRPIPDLRVYILDEHLNPVPIGWTGELYVGGAGVARGYLNRSQLTSERFVADPFSQDAQARLYKTGDLGRWRSDGDIEYLGRNDFQVKIRGYRIELGEIEAELLKHPHVVEAAVIAREDSPGQKRLLGYVVVDVPRLKALQRQHTGDLGAELVDQWKAVFEQTYSEEVTGPTFAGWNSSYSGRPIPEQQMQEWLRTTLERIRALKPRKVLEIGCGVGLLLQHLAAGCEVYRGTDISAVAIERLRSWISKRAELQHIDLERHSALELDTTPAGGYDTVVINSVVQLFPDIEYLREVLKRAVGWISPGGHIFVGDVRPLGLLRVFQSSVQLERAVGSTSTAQLKGLISQALEREKDLLIDPRFFEELPRQIPAIGSVKILLRRGESDNELTRYRYDVVLQVGKSATGSEPQRIEWSATDITRLAAQVSERRLPAVRICGVPNRRLYRDIAAAKLVDTADESTTVERLREQLSQTESSGEDPEEFWRIGEAYGFNVRIGWQLGGDVGLFDVEWSARTPVDGEVTFCESKDCQLEQVVSNTEVRYHYANDPWGRSLQRQIVPRLREFLEERLPPYMVPAAIVALDELPLTENGKLNRRALPDPPCQTYSRQPYEAPQGEVEEALAGIWQELLRVERIGRYDNFFELGGHSLLIAQMVERLRREGLSVDVRSVFESPTLAVLAGTLGRQMRASVTAPPNLIPRECQAIMPHMLTLIKLEPEHIERIAEAVPGGARNIQDIYPLAPLQEGILFHHLLSEKSATYIAATLFEVRSRTKLDAFVNALQGLVDRHDALRTAILWEQLPRPVQVVYRRATMTIEEVELDPSLDPIEQLKQRMLPEYQRLTLSQPPLMHLQVAADPQGRHWYVLLQLHHLASDRISLEVMTSEVISHLQGGAEKLPEPVPYRDHVAQTLSIRTEVEAGPFFRSRLLRIEEPTAPFGLLNVYGDGRQIEEASELIDATLASRVRSQARSLKVGAATLFHAVWALVVSRTSGRSEVVFGTVLSGRMHGGVGAQRAIGMFINTLPLRLRLQGLAAGELVEQMHRELLELLKYEQVPLTTAQRCSGISGSAPLFTALLNYMQIASDGTEGFVNAGLQIRVLASRWRTNYPISLTVNDGDEGFLLTAQTDRSIDPRRILGYVSAAMKSLLEALEEAPQTPALSLSILPERERHLVIGRFNATRVMYPQEKLVHELIEEQVERTPDAVAVVYEGQTLTYAELNGRANQLARYLREKGVRPDQRLGICVERGPEMVVALLGILKAGGAYVPLDPSYPPERLNHMLRDASPTVLLTQERLKGKLRGASAEVVALDEDWLKISQQPSRNLDKNSLGLHSHHLAYLIYTSGSTGQPKGAMNEHGGVVNRLQWMQDQYRLGPEDRVLQKTPFSFDVSVWEFFWTLMSGARLIVARPEGHKDAGYLRKVIEETGVTTLHFVPSMLRSFLDQCRAGECPSVRHVVCSGEELSASLQRKCFECLPQAQLSNLYGPTEAAVDVTAWECRADDQSPCVPIGRPIANMQIYVLDSSKQLVPVGVAGEIYIGGVGVGRGYLNRPELTAERFLADPFSAEPNARIYKTGDLGRWRSDASIEYLGRNDLQVKIRGFRIELGEIEAQLAKHPDVKETVVLAREDVPGDKRLVAYVIPRDPSSADAVSGEALRAYLKPVLPEYMVPSVFVTVESFPLSPNGKLDRRALPAPEIGAYASGQYEPPQGETEEIVAAIWQELLRVKRVGRQDNFFELGGHSLLAMQVVVRVQLSMPVEVPISVLFECPTVERLSARLDELRKATLIEGITDGGSETEELLEKVALMPESKVQELLRELSAGGKP